MWAPGRVSCGPGHFRKHGAWVDRGQADGVVLGRGEGLVERIPEGLGPEPGTGTNPGPSRQEFSHPVESLALTVEEVMGVRRVLVKAEMEKFLQNKELLSSLKKGKVRRARPALRGPAGVRLRAGPGPARPGQDRPRARPSLQICCCCRTKFPLFSWPPTCLFCKR